MTEQYAQQSINIEEGVAINRQTPNNTPLLITLGELTANGSSLIVFIEGGGSDPAAPDSHSYVTHAFCIFGRIGGTTAENSQSITTNADGDAVTVAFNVTGDVCQLSITGPNRAYDHRLTVVASVII